MISPRKSKEDVMIKLFNGRSSCLQMFFKIAGPFTRLSTRVWQNAHENTARRAMVCDIYFTFSKIL